MKEIRGITIKGTIGIGDKLQYSSLPENYFKTTGRRLADVSRCWIFDHNPHVDRLIDVPQDQVIEMWNFGPSHRPRPRPTVYLSNAEHHAAMLKVNVFLNRPRLYKFEDFPFERRTKILLHTNGISHGVMPDHVIQHVLKKYRYTDLFHIGLPSDPDLGIPKLATPTLWDLAREISEAKMLISMDSGPCWIAACYPDVIIKKLRMKPTPEQFKTWIPLEIDNIHSHWDDRAFQAFNPTEDDIGFTYSYKRL